MRYMATAVTDAGIVKKITPLPDCESTHACPGRWRSTLSGAVTGVQPTTSTWFRRGLTACAWTVKMWRAI